MLEDDGFWRARSEEREAEKGTEVLNVPGEVGKGSGQVRSYRSS